MTEGSRELVRGRTMTMGQLQIARKPKSLNVRVKLAGDQVKWQ